MTRSSKVIDKFVDEYKFVNDQGKTKSNEEIKNDILEFVSTYDKISTRWSNFYLIRNKLGIHTPLITPPVEWKKIIDEQTKSAFLDREDKDVDIMEFEDIIFSDPNVLKGSELFIWLMSVTGRRGGELMENEFQVIDGKLNYYPAKKRAEAKNVFCIIEKLLSGTPDNVMELIMKCRDDLKNVDKTVARNAINRILKKKYKTISNGMMLRSVYVNYILDNEKVIDKNNRITLTAQLLCHDNKQPSSAQRYNKVSIYDKVNIKRPIKELQTTIEGGFKCNACIKNIQKRGWTKHIKTQGHIKNIEGENWRL